MKSLHLFAICISLLLGLSAKSEPLFNQLEPAMKNAWMKLMHFSSEKQALIHSPSFYLSQSKDTPLEVEFRINLAEFKNNPLSYACQFPARSHFLSRITKNKLTVCPEVQNWKQRIDAQSISLVYVSQYVSNPASVFGHTFLILNSENRPKGLHTTINNAADMPPSVSNYDYVLKGLSGGFKAVNYIENFATKNQEYGSIENRDLWIFDLNLTANNVDQFLNHIWELDHSSSEGYFFLNKNCSVFLVNSLAAVVNDIDFVNPYFFYFMPLESAKQLRPLIQKEVFIPSLRKKLSHRIDSMPLNRRKRFYNYLSNPQEKVISSDTNELDALIDYFEFKKSQQSGSLSLLQNKQYDQTLISRSKLTDSSFVKISPPASPLNSFKTSRVSLSTNYKSRSLNSFISFSPLYHSLLQKEDGFIPFSEVILFDSKFNLDEKKLQEFTFLRLTNFPEQRNFDSIFSWTGSLFLENHGLKDRFNLNFNLKAGKTYALNNLLFYNLLGPTLNPRSRITSQLETGILFKSSHIRMQLALQLADYDIQHSYGSNLFFKLNADLNPSLDLELVNKYDRHLFHHEFILNYFF